MLVLLVQEKKLMSLFLSIGILSFETLEGKLLPPLQLKIEIELTLDAELL